MTISALEADLYAQLSLMQHKAVDPWPAFETEFVFDAGCCAHGSPYHAMLARPDHICNGCFNEGIPHPQGAKMKRRWRADFAYLAPYNLLIEVDGAVFTAGRHTRGKGWENDARKQARAVELGYRVLRFSGGQVKSGEALNAIGACLGVGE